jgi:hypothetical protein
MAPWHQAMAQMELNRNHFSTQIGEHTDYNDGFVMPCAIDRHMIAAVTPTDTDEIVVISTDNNSMEDRYSCFFWPDHSVLHAHTSIPACISSKEM